MPKLALARALVVALAVATAARTASATSLSASAFPDAQRAFRQAQGAPPGPDRDALWREAAAKYEAYFDAAPDADDAPEAAINAAYAFKQVGELERALGLYARLIATYGSDSRLEQLVKGNAAKHVAPEPRKYAERLKFLQIAYDALAVARVATFRFTEAADTFAQMANGARFDPAWRRTAAHNAVVLFSSIGDEKRMKELARVITALQPTAEERARIEFLLAEHLYKKWDPAAPNADANKKARADAEAALAAFYERNKDVPEAKLALVEAAFQVGRAKQAAADPAFRAWYARVPPLAARMTPADGHLDDLAAEAEFRVLDEEIRTTWDSAPNRAKYCGAMDDVIGAFGKRGERLTMGTYDKDALVAQSYVEKLDAITRARPKSEWTATALTRGASVFEGLRKGLLGTTTPGSCFQFFTRQQTAVLTVMKESGRAELEDQAKQIQANAPTQWHDRREARLHTDEQPMIARYAQAAALGNARAIERLAYYTGLFGDAKLQTYVTTTPDPADPTKMLTYTPQMYLTRRPGLHALPGVGPSTPSPLP